MVDDVPANAKLLRSLVMNMGQSDVEMASDDHSALDQASRFRRDVVFLDINLPDLDGYEVAKQLRRQPQLADTYIVALSDTAEPQARERQDAAVFDEYLVKPASVEMIRSVLARSKLVSHSSDDA